MKSIFLTLGFFLLSVLAFADKKVTISAQPNQSVIFQIDGTGKEVQIGIGTAQIKVDKDVPTKVVVRLEGYKPVFKTYSNGRNTDLPSQDQIVLEDRLVKLTVQPFDSRIVVNGVDLGQNSAWVEIKKDATITVEVKNKGFYTRSKTYNNRSGLDVPPVNDMIGLTDRAIQVKTSPADVSVIVNGKKVGEGITEIVVPTQGCVTVEYVKEGYVTMEKSYCAKEGMPLPPIMENIQLKDRVVAVRTTPEDATIRIDGRVMGTGDYKTKIPYDQCVEVIVQKPGFVPIKKNYCNEDGMQPPPVAEHLIMKQDEAYTSSVQSDQANVNFTIECSQPEPDSWKVISQITMSYFDNIELADRETGYIRTAWNVKSFENNTIRTRIIVKQADTNPLKYTIKLVSEFSGEAQTSVKDDEKFRSWDRILNMYKDVISEYQSRLK